MLLSSFASAAILPMVLRTAGPAVPCAAGAGVATKGARLFIEAVKPSAADTVLTARLCLIPPESGVGSYTATLTFDSSAMRAVRVDVSGGLQAKNTSVAGVIKLAGAAPRGFGRGPLATIVFWRPKKKQLAPIRVTLVEVSSTTGATLLADSRVSGYPSSDAALGVVGAPRQTTGSSASTRVPPHIDSISRRSGCRVGSGGRSIWKGLWGGADRGHV